MNEQLLPHLKLIQVYSYARKPVIYHVQILLVQVLLRQKFYAPQVRPDAGFELMTSRS